MNQEEKNMMSERIVSEERYRNYCETCRNFGGPSCITCVSGHDGIPSAYRFELAPKTQAEIRSDILEQAKECVCADRNEQYGEPEDNFAVIAELWEAYLKRCAVPAGTDITITETMVADLMLLFKIGRNATAVELKKDTYVDIAGYAACAGAMLQKEDTEEERR